MVDARHGLAVARYVDLNPVRAGLCRAPDSWPWSSHAATAGLAPRPEWLDDEWLLGPFGLAPARARERYRGFVADGVVPTA